MNRAEKRRQRKLAGKTARNAKPVQSAGPSPGQPTPAIQQALALAVQHHNAGRLPEAENICRRLLQADPNQPVVLHLLGVIAHQVGKNDDAVDLIAKALAVKPDYAEAHYNLGNALQGLEKLDEAADSYRKAVAIKPRFAEAHNNLGLVFQDLGKPDKAIGSYHKALAIVPRVAEVHYNLGNALRDLERLDEAVACYHKALAIRPDYADAHNNLGNALKNLERLDEAVDSFHSALAIKPDFADAHNNLGIALKKQGQLDEAVASYHRALAIKPDYAEAHNNLGSALREQNKLDEAVASHHRALAIKPDYAEAHFDLGITLQDMGKLDEAADNYHKALAIKPDYAGAHRLLAYIRKFSEYDNDIKAMEDTYAMPGLRDEERMQIAFGLGKSFEDLQQYEKAFGFYLTGNAIKRETFDFSIEGYEKYSENLKKIFTAKLFAKYQGASSSDETPIFILGMPRSGTTLVEQILASHPKVHGAGEIAYLSKIIDSRFSKCGEGKFTEIINQSDASHFSKAGGEYISMIRQESKSAKFITDKTPNNFYNIGVIKLMLQNAKVIHCRRDPMDTCLSNFKKLFVADGMSFTYDLSELGQYYNLYRDLMNHWHSVLPDFIYDIQYEDMVADQEKQSRALLTHCGLEWDDACLEFYKTKRPVKTASATQVRRPIYKDSIQLWKKYGNQLAPLLEAL